MKNLKKSVLLVLSLMLALSIVACGQNNGVTNTSTTTETTNASDSTETNEPQSEVTTLYQFVGEYDELKSYDMDFDFIVNMQSDGTGIAYHLMGDTLEEIPLTYTCEEDRDGITTMNIEIGDDDYTIYMEDDATFKLQYHFYFAGGYSRFADLIGSSDVQYTDVEAWKQEVLDIRASEMESVTDSSETAINEVTYSFWSDIVTVVDSGEVISNCAAQVDLYADGTVAAQDGYVGDGTVAYAYVTENGTWSESDDTLTIVLNENTYTAIKTDGVYSFVWNATHDEGLTQAEMVQK